ncbi:MAG: dihydrofolate reductase [Hyphomicrobiales bacterium]|uniref:dihydrofolate reductase n=1 Tax=Rhabdaerophilum calidifontis TaxID=2604328 RepID=UPI00123BD0D1|nr:dihydrofolate reductase [Rhabdaerophilum calidifontis]MCA1998472.1 dihydrofolate reductase [Hyphomicrobiales bacterium]
MAEPAIVLVAAVARNGVIGRDNRLLWRLKSDMRHFRALTMGRPVIMGRRTYESIGAPLPGRRIIVVTRDPAWHAEGVAAAPAPEAALALARIVAAETGGAEIIVAGGAEIYAAFLGMADRLEITEVDLAPEGDAVFPAIDTTLWREESRVSGVKTADDEAAFAFVRYARR